jgi:diacylglycerol O-acyltransferase
MAEQQISVQDALWLNMDRPNNLMIIDSVLWFTESPDWDAVRAVIEERMIQQFPVFSSKPVKRKDGMYWVTDPKFNLDNHLIHANLPGTATLGDVQRYVNAQRSKPLPKTKPMWAFHFIDNVVNDKGQTGAVVMARFHHSIADGVRLVQVILGLCDPIQGEVGVAAAVGAGRSLDSGAKSGSGSRLDKVKGAALGLGGKAQAAGMGAVEQVKASAGLAKQAGASAASSVGEKVKAAASDPGAAAKSVPAALSGLPGQVAGAAAAARGIGENMLDDTLDVVGDPGQLADAFATMAPVPDEATNTAASVAKLALAGTSVKTSWSGTPGVAKEVYWVNAFRLDRVKQVGKKTNTTVNDVLLALVAGMLRRYLAAHGESVDEVMWMVPVSLKPFDPGMPEELGNHFALIAVKMPVDIEDPRECLREVSRRVNKIKKSHEAVVTFGVQRVVATSPERMSVFLTNFFANKAVGVLTNVPGPRGQIALAGTPVEGVLGWAPSSGDQPMTITIFSYNGRVHVGFGVDKKLVPDGERLSEFFVEEALAMWESIMGELPPREDIALLGSSDQRSRVSPRFTLPGAAAGAAVTSDDLEVRHAALQAGARRAAGWLQSLGGGTRRPGGRQHAQPPAVPRHLLPDPVGRRRCLPLNPLFQDREVSREQGRSRSHHGQG